MKYHAELTDEFDIDESKEYYDSEGAKVSRLLDNISTWINTEKRRIEETIDDFTSDVGVSPQDSVSNIGRRNLPFSRNSNGLRRQRSISSKSSNTMISGERSRAALIVETSTLHKRQAIQMEECLLESEIQKTQLEQDRARLELEHRKEQLKLETELLKIQAREDGIISHASLNRDNNHDENRKISQVSISPKQPAPECLARNIPGRMEFEESAKASDMRLGHSTPKEKEISVKGIASPSLKETVDHQETGISSENPEGKVSQGSPEHVETSSASQTTIKYTNQGKGTSPPVADDRSGRSFHELMVALQRE